MRLHRLRLPVRRIFVSNTLKLADHIADNSPTIDGATVSDEEISIDARDVENSMISALTRLSEKLDEDAVTRAQLVSAISQLSGVVNELAVTSEQLCAAVNELAVNTEQMCGAVNNLTFAIRESVIEDVDAFDQANVIRKIARSVVSDPITNRLPVASTGERPVGELHTNTIVGPESSQRQSATFPSRTPISSLHATPSSSYASNTKENMKNRMRPDTRTPSGRAQKKQRTSI